MAESSAPGGRVPKALRAYTRKSVLSHRVPWYPTRWESVFVRHEGLFEDLTSHAIQEGGITREFVHALASGDRDPVELFLVAMVWGFGPIGYGPKKTARMLDGTKSKGDIRKIVQAARNRGPAAGWSALLADHKVPGLGLSFGTKLLYFAGYGAGHELRPLVLDDRVRWSLHDLSRGTVPPPGFRVMKKHYLDYLELALSWAADPTWQQEPDVVEYGLFDLNGRYPVDVVIPSTNDRR